MSSNKPTVSHNGKTTTVTYYHDSCSKQSITNRPATVYKSPNVTKVVYRKK